MPRNIEKCLRDFIRHVQELEHEEDPAGSGFHREFRTLRETQVQKKREELFPAEEGKKDYNIKKNRYKDILPRDDLRVKLSSVNGEEGSDYINATLIRDVDGKSGYIAAQGPMRDTVIDFWRMLWEYKTEIVFMACRLMEMGKSKCEKYWADEGKSLTFGNIIVTTEKEEEVQQDFIKRTLKATQGGASQTLTQFHYMGWPDHGTPSSPATLRIMIETVRNFRNKPNIPMVIHCSAGCGRTGTVCAIDYAWTLLDKGRINNGFSMMDIIQDLREQRLSMVQTPDQYEYAHKVVQNLCQEWLAEFAKNDYENVEPEVDYYNVEMDGHSHYEQKENVYNEIEEHQSKQPKFAAVRKDKESARQKLQTDSVVQNIPALYGNVAGLASLPKPNMKPKPQVGSPPKPIPVPVVEEASNPTPIAPVRRSSKKIHENFTAGLDIGEYVEVKCSDANLPSSPPPEIPIKKNSPAFALAKLDTNPEAHSTVITIKSGATKVTKFGTVAASQSKSQPTRAALTEQLFDNSAVNNSRWHQPQQLKAPNDNCVYALTTPSLERTFSDSARENHTISHGYDNIGSKAPLGQMCQNAQHINRKAAIKSKAPLPISTQQDYSEAPPLPNRSYSPEEAGNASSNLEIVKDNDYEIVDNRRKPLLSPGPVVVSLQPNAAKVLPLTNYSRHHSDSAVPEGNMAHSGPRTAQHNHNRFLYSDFAQGVRPARVKGPRPMPDHWKEKSKSSKSTYL